MKSVEVRTAQNAAVRVQELWAHTISGSVLSAIFGGEPRKNPSRSTTTFLRFTI
jgi:hypothetical protein